MKTNKIDELIKDFRFNEDDSFIDDDYVEPTDQDRGLYAFLEQTMYKPKKKEIESIEDNEE
jgi:hypothetical protein